MKSVLNKALYDKPVMQALLAKLALTRVFGLLSAGFVVFSPAASAQGGLPGASRINGQNVWLAFEPQREILQQSSAVIYTDERSRIKSLYGVIVSEDGHILTKASEIENASQLSLRIGNELYLDVERLGVDPGWDVALLKVAPKVPTIPVSLGHEEDIQLGYWVVSNGSTSRYQRRVKVGIISAATRGIFSDKSHVVLGIGFGVNEEEELSWKVETLTEGKGAQKAGVEVEDILLSVDGVTLNKREDLIDVLRDKKPGDMVAIRVKRGGKTLGFDVELSAREERMTRNEQMSGGELQLSERRSEFPRAVQHDTPVNNDDMGGPLLNLDGICIGMNIARASRVATYAIPAPELRDIISRMVE